MTDDPYMATTALLMTLAEDLSALSRLPLPAEARGIVLRLQERIASHGLGAETHLPNILDETVLDGLLQLIGPDSAADLIAQVQTDLRTVRHELGAALAQSAIPALRKQSHDLISISGSIGAERLLLRAREVNKLANAQDPAGLSAATHLALTEIETVLSRLGPREGPRAAQASVPHRGGR